MFDIIGNIEIQIPVIIIIPECRTRSPSRITDTCLLSNIGKRAIAVVPIQHIFRIVRDIKIQIPVVIIITENTAHAVATVTDTRLLGDIGKRTITIVAIQRISRRCLRYFRMKRTGVVDDVKVDVTITVVVGESCTRTDIFGE